MNHFNNYYKLCLILIGIFLVSSFYEQANNYIVRRQYTNGHLNSMPIVKTTLPAIHSSEPVAKRSEEYRFYLQASVRIHSNGSVGSGTICYYDSRKNIAYIISCGHLFNGNKLPNKGRPTYVNIDVFYKNDKKLEKPQRFRAEVICHDRKEDISFLKFKPDWDIKQYFAIAPVNYRINEGDIYESTGCDGATETASYTVRIKEGMTEGTNLVTVENSPRPGRSGGGLLSRDGLYIAIVWGTSALDGSGYGVYVPLRRIHAYARQFEEISWLLDIGGVANVFNDIPMIDDENTPQNYPKGYIPRP